MSTLTKETIERVAHLARLAISEEEIMTHVKNLSNILDLVEQMNAVQTQNIPPMAHPLTTTQPMRKDCVTEGNERKILQDSAEPGTIKSGLYIVPKAYDIIKE